MSNDEFEILILPSGVPKNKNSVIELLKSETVSDVLLDWASTQSDREIALAMLMNSKTSQKHLEHLFECFENAIDSNFKKYNRYSDREIEQDEKDTWDILDNIQHHINWEQEFNFSDYWQDNVYHKITLEKEIDSYSYGERIEYCDRYNFSRRKLITLFSINYNDWIGDFVDTTNENNCLFFYKRLINYFFKKYNIVLSSKRNKDESKKLSRTEVHDLLNKNINIHNTKWSYLLAESPYTPVHILEEYADYANLSKLTRACRLAIERKLARNPSISEKIFFKLAPFSDYDIHHSLFKNKGIENSIKKKWQSKKAEKLRKEALISDSDNYDAYRIRSPVAGNLNTDIQTLKMLAQDEDYEVRLNVAKNPYITPEIRDILLQDKKEKVRYAITGNPNLTKNDFYTLMRDIYGKTNYSLACLLAFLDPNISPEILEQNADSLLWNERFVIAIHPKIPQHILEKLSNDGNIYVRAAALEHLKQFDSN